MKIKREVLLDMISTASKLAKARSPIEVLKCCHLLREKDELWCCATDSQMSVRVSTGYPGDDSIDCLIPAAQTAQILRSMHDEHVTVGVSKPRVTIQGASSQFQVLRSDGSLPQMSFKPDNRFTVSAPQLEKAIRLCNVGDRGEMTAGYGMCFFCEGETLKISHREGSMGSAGSIEDVVGMEFEPFAITTDHAAMLAGLLSRGDDVTIATDNRNVGFKCGDITVFCRTLEGTPFDTAATWERFTKDRKEWLTFNAESLLDGIRQASLATDAESMGLDFEFTGSRVLLKGGSKSLGESEVEVEFGGYLEETKRYIHKPLAEFLSAYGEGDVRVSVGSPLCASAGNHTFLVADLEKVE